MQASYLVLSSLEELKSYQIQKDVKNQKKVINDSMPFVKFYHKRPENVSYEAYKQAQKDQKVILKALYPTSQQSGSKHFREKQYHPYFNPFK